MLARVFSCAVIGLAGVIVEVEVEVDYFNGMAGAFFKFYITYLLESRNQMPAENSAGIWFLFLFQQSR